MQIDTEAPFRAAVCTELPKKSSRTKDGALAAKRDTDKWDDSAASKIAAKRRKRGGHVEVLLPLPFLSFFCRFFVVFAIFCQTIKLARLESAR